MRTFFCKIEFRLAHLQFFIHYFSLVTINSSCLPDSTTKEIQNKSKHHTYYMPYYAGPKLKTKKSD